MTSVEVVGGAGLEIVELAELDIIEVA